MKTQDSQEIAWNGIQFQCPASWRISEMGAHHLCLEDDTALCMEIKWGGLKGRFSPETYLRKLNKRYKSGRGIGATISPVPESWGGNLTRFDHAGFSWKSAVRSGKGVILHCKVCGTATVIHFFPRKEADAHIPYEVILGSFQDHHNNGAVPLAVFGLRAVIPRIFLLTSHRFEAGVADLEFTGKQQRIRLFRWGPASVLLAHRELESLARQGLDIPKVDCRELILGDRRGLQWIGEKTFAGKIPFLGKFARRPPFERICLWHVQERNRILGAVFSGRIPLEIAVMDQVLACYETT